MDMEAKLEEHRTIALQLKEIKAKEMKLRTEIVDAYDDGEKLSGVSNFSESGFKIKVTKRLNYNIDQDEFLRLVNEERLSEEEFGLIQTKYSLKLTDYKKAGNTDALDEAIIVKPAAPSLLIELGE